MADAIWAHETDADVRVQQIRPVVAQTLRVCHALEAWLEGPSFSEVHNTLARSATKALAALESPVTVLDREVVVYPGSPSNFYTLDTSIDDALFAPLGPQCPARPPELQHDFVLFQVPRHEGSNPLWRPVTLGHELAHVPAGHLSAKTEIAQLLSNLIDANAAAGIALPFPKVPPGTIGVFVTAANWVTELLCDAYAVLRFGPAGLASLAEFLDVVGAAAGDHHPPKWLRVECMLAWLGVVPAELKSLIDPFAELAIPPTNLAPWEQFLTDIMRQAAMDVLAIAASWLHSTYDFAARADIAVELATKLDRGLPCAQLFDTAGAPVELDEADIVNACWLQRLEPGDGRPPTEALAAKALSDLEFLDTWEAAGGTLLQALPPIPAGDALGIGVLHYSEIARRLRAPHPDTLVVTPLLPQNLTGAAIDLRLGKSFIVFARAGFSSFDSLDELDVTALQRSVELDWGGSLVLHPNELVLAATLEYLAIPEDLTAQVITRSSFGRLGLLSATAVQVHPGFRGCLTLELVNLSNVPLHVSPGQRIAQLVLSHVDGHSLPNTPSKYDCPTRPQFSMVRADVERPVLTNLRIGANGD